MPEPLVGERELIHSLLLLTLSPQRATGAFDQLGLAGREETEFLRLANSHHVIVRALTALQPLVNAERKERISAALQHEEARITNALRSLNDICGTLEQNNCPVVVIKSLDHSPDLGNDLDLFTTASAAEVVKVFTKVFGATIQPRSWGDRLANKWNFEIPGLPESVEVHCERIGQTGEQVALAKRFVQRRVQKDLQGYTFVVPAPEERIIVSCLQRMYRHFYFRICDIVNAANLMQAKEIDYNELRRACMAGGIWPGVATYLRVVRDYIGQYREETVSLPEQVENAASFGADKLYVQRGFIRVPILPEGASFYRHEIAAAARRGDMPATLRLSLLPPLASAAAVAYKLTGSDKGVW